MLLTALLALTSPQTPWSAPDPTAVAAANLLSGNGGLRVVKADLNGDGRDDLVTVAEADNSLQGYTRLIVSLGQGDGTFSLPLDSLASWDGLFDGTLYLEVTVDDFNGDGHADLLIPYLSGSGLPWDLLVADGDGTGHFAVPRVIGSLPELTNFTLAADLNQDGLLDAVWGTTLNVSYALGLAGGGFGPLSMLFDSPLRVANLSVRDVTANGSQDLVLSTLSNSGVSGLTFNTALIQGTGTLPFDTSSATELIDDLLIRMTVDDLDSDGDLEVFGSSYTDAYLVEGLGGGGFAPARALPTELVGSNLEAHDLNGDGQLDLLGLSFTSVTSTPQIGALTFGQPRTELVERFDSGITLDANADGIVDLAVPKQIDSASLFFSKYQRPAISLGTETATGEFSVAASNPIDERLGLAAPATADVDGDGFLEVFGLDLSTGSFGMKPSLGDGVFGKAVKLAELGDLAVGNFGIPDDVYPLVADFTGDGIEDVAYAEAGEREIQLRVGNGVGGFAPPFIAGTAPFLMADWVATDLDADGASDLVWMTRSRTAIYFAFGSSSGVLTPPTSLSGQLPAPASFAVGDLDADGDQDFLFVHNSAVEASLQQAPRQFGARVATGSLLSWISQGSELSLADLDGDLGLDLVFVTNSPRRRYWARGLGSGSFADEILLGNANVNEARHFGDWDLDGDQDYVVSWRAPAFGAPPFGFHENVGAGVFLPAVVPTQTPLPLSAGALAFGDMDSDGDQEMLIATGNGILHVATNEALGAVGDTYCGPAVPNSTGQAAELRASGSVDVSVNRMSLNASGLPANSFGYFLTSQLQGFTTSVPGSVGTICLASPIGRFIDASEIRQSSQAGTFSLDIDLTAIPTPVFGRVPVAPGETWNFQAWYRDVDGAGGATSNFTDGLSVVF
jgi:hypothetical protein